MSVWVVCTPTPTYLAQGTPARTPAHLPTYLARALRVRRPVASPASPARAASPAQRPHSLRQGRRSCRCLIWMRRFKDWLSRPADSNRREAHAKASFRIGKCPGNVLSLWPPADSRGPPAWRLDLLPPLPTYCWLRGRPQSRACLPTRRRGSLTTASLPGKCTEPCRLKSHNREHAFFVSA